MIWFDVPERWPSDDDPYDDDKLVVKERLSDGFRFIEIMHFTQWTSREYARGMRGLCETEFTKVTHWAPLPDLPARSEPKGES